MRYILEPRGSAHYDASLRSKSFLDWAAEVELRRVIPSLSDRPMSIHQYNRDGSGYIAQMVSEVTVWDFFDSSRCGKCGNELNQHGRYVGQYLTEEEKNAGGLMLCPAQMFPERIKEIRGQVMGVWGRENG
jgi:hypothetical protein